MIDLKDRSCRKCRLGRLRRHGSYGRFAVPSRLPHIIRIQRYRCGSCGKTCSLKPDFLWPRRSYVLAKIIAAISAHQQGWSVRRIARTVRVPRSTVRHWCHDAHQHLLPALKTWLPRELAVQVPDADVTRLVVLTADWLTPLIRLLRSHAARHHPSLSRGPHCPFRFLLRYLSARRALTAFNTTQDRPGNGLRPQGKGPPGGVSL